MGFCRQKLTENTIKLLINMKYVKLNFVGDVFFLKNCTQRFHEFFSGNQAVKLTAASRDSSRRLLLWVEAAAGGRAPSLSSSRHYAQQKLGGIFRRRARAYYWEVLPCWLGALLCCCELRGRARAFRAVARTRLVRESSPQSSPSQLTMVGISWFCPNTTRYFRVLNH